MRKEWWNTLQAAWAFTIIGIGGGVVLTYLSPWLGIPVGVIIIGIGVWLLIRAYRMRGIVTQTRNDETIIQPVAYPKTRQALVNTPRIALVELSIPKVVYTIEMEHLNEPQIHIEPFLISTGGEMVLESAKVEIAGESIPCYNWRILDLWPGQTSVTGTYCKIPHNLPKGEHTIRLLIYANKEWWASDWGTINYEPSIPDKKDSPKQ